MKRRKIKLYSIFLLVLALFGCSNTNNRQVLQDLDPTALEQIPLDELLDLVQKTTFNYFWEFAEPISGMARERSQPEAYNHESPNIITIGGSGFGIASFPVAIERGWVLKNEVIQRLRKILTFLENADVYHGAFSHWYFGNTGKTRPFSDLDDGGDIVETAFLMQGLLINRQYFSGDTNEEKDLRNRITSLWEATEWNWYTNQKKSITWHWSPKNNFDINLEVKGWNEALIVYILAAASPTYSIDKETYDNGWASNGEIKNGKSYYNMILPLGPDFGGPLFFAHYSFIGLDPRNLSDMYSDNYFEQNRAHSIINYSYCRDNPNDYIGYGGDSWGLTASDNHQGYSAHNPTNDLGIITPTAALSSFPYTPAESKKALEFFYYKQGNRLFGQYGFYDAFSEHHNWYSDGYLAIDQGPIVSMIENYRSQLIWNLFMKDQEIINGLQKLGFASPHIK